jgi:hypothetical protein
MDCAGKAQRRQRFRADSGCEKAAIFERAKGVRCAALRWLVASGISGVATGNSIRAFAVMGSRRFAVAASN